MATICDNFVRITHRNADKMKALTEAAQQGKFCEFVEPLPEGDEWYEFANEHWGTKWEEIKQARARGKVLRIRFLTSWAPPQPIYTKLTSEGFDIQAVYFLSEEEVCGRWYDGSHERFRLEDVDLDDIPELIGDDIDEMFKVTQTIAEFRMVDEDDELDD
jgi:hypothetical protein